jgi:CRP-like cAMP-binding protein
MQPNQWKLDPLSAQLSDSELTCLEQGEELWLQQGAAFITEGEPAENFYVLFEGQVRVSKKNRRE